MNKLVFILLSMASLGAWAQPLEEQVLFTVANDTVTAGEYMAVYNKNRGLGEDIDPKTPEEYLDLYINFKLKVHAAREMGMDTIASFLREYRSYRDQLAKPYLTDRDVTEDLVREAYDRMKYDVRASHVMIKVAENAPPEDTLEAYNRIMTVKKRIEEGASFDQIAGEYSDDSYSARQGGDLGYFTVFNMVYPFESAVYNTDVGMMKGPFRTRYGYHLVKNTDRRPARGQVTVAHIMLVSNKQSDEESQANAEKKIQEIYQQLQAGANFETLVKQYSEDEPSVENAGVLPPFGINKMFEPFEDAAFSLEQPGDISKPVKTPVGWHIIKLVSKSNIPTWDDVKAELKQRVEQDSRSQQSRISIVKKLKGEYNFREYPEAREKSFAQVDQSFLEGNFQLNSQQNQEAVLFEFANQKYRVKDFYQYLSELRGRKQNSLYQELRQAYESFVDSRLIAYEKSRLEDKYPEFRLLSREYFEGILLFDLTEDKVWRKSVSDTTGLLAYYEAHKDQYQWGERYHSILLDASSKKLLKEARKMLAAGRSPADIQNELNGSSQLNVKLDSGVYEAGEKDILALISPPEEGFSKRIKKDGRYFQVYVLEIIPPAQKSFEEARGRVISDYQSHLEQEWINNLKASYEVQVKAETLNAVIEELDSDS